MTFTMPYSYAGETVTEEQLLAKQRFYRLHPEVQKRFLAMAKYLAARGIPLGVGGGWRIQPVNKKGFAKPGNSWHEGVPVESKENALAIDVVPASSWAEMEKVLHLFGFRSFLYLGEPWHIQPIEISASRRYATTLPPLKNWDLPEIQVPVPTPAPTPTPTPPPPSSGSQEITVNFKSRTLRQGMTGKDVRYFQRLLNSIGGQNLVVDGEFGAQTRQGFRNWQSYFGLYVDGVAGPQTQGHIVSIALLKG